MSSFLPAAACSLTGRLAIATALTVTAPVLCASAAQAATAPARTATHLSIAAPASVVAGNRAAVTFVLRSTAGTPISGARVRVEARIDGIWRGLSAVNTNSNGQGRWTGTITTTRNYRAVLPATTVLAPTTSASVTVKATAPVVALGQRVLGQARAQIGDPYVYGATGPNAFDCSGLTGYAYAHSGRTIPRTSGQQYAASRHISKSSARPGDLIFMSSGGRISHVGVYAGNGRMVDAPKPGGHVSERAIWTTSYVVGRVG